jgi:uncharacterized damage-inducible protein DinB
MSTAAHALAAELERESAITRRVLERVPTGRLDWQPHTKSMTLGQLAQHIALIPAIMTRFSQLDGLDLATRKFEYAQGENTPAILATFDGSVVSAKEALNGLDEGTAMATWRLTVGERQVFAWPRIDMMRMMGLHHQIHHRGELVVYLRLLDVPVPIVYGKSADESPFPQPAAV